MSSCTFKYRWLYTVAVWVGLKRLTPIMHLWIKGEEGQHVHLFITPPRLFTGLRSSQKEAQKGENNGFSPGCQLEVRPSKFTGLTLCLTVSGAGDIFKGYHRMSRKQETGHYTCLLWRNNLPLSTCPLHCWYYINKYIHLPENKYFNIFPKMLIPDLLNYTNNRNFDRIISILFLQWSSIALKQEWGSSLQRAFCLPNVWHFERGNVSTAALEDRVKQLHL